MHDTDTSIVQKALLSFYQLFNPYFYMTAENSTNSHETILLNTKLLNGGSPLLLDVLPKCFGFRLRPTESLVVM
jgi:hypothetical protein